MFLSEHVLKVFYVPFLRDLKNNLKQYSTSFSVRASCCAALPSCQNSVSTYESKASENVNEWPSVETVSSSVCFRQLESSFQG